MNMYTYLALTLSLLLHSLLLSQSSFENSVEFDGFGDYAYTIGEPILPTANGTIETWIKVNNITSENDLSLGDAFFTKNEEQWNAGDFYTFIESSSGKLKARIQSDQYPIEIDVQSDNSFYNHLESWVHMAFTWGNLGMKLYINGILQMSQNQVTHSAMNNSCNIYIGAEGYKLHSGSYVIDNFFTGQIDEVRIWNHQRTNEQIIALWDEPLDSSYFVTIDSGLVGYWRFDELEDLGVNNDGIDDVRDFSVLHNHLDLEGDAHLVPSNIVIPVELISFTAEFNGNIVNLDWITATEINNFGFEIERKLANLEWTTIGFVEGNGTITEQQSYSYDDDFTVFSYEGNVHYRLKQIDMDGTYEYFDPIKVFISFMPEDYSLLQNYPNPFNPSTTISWQIPERNFIKLEVYDVLGNKVDVLENHEMSAGFYNTKFIKPGLPSGVYFYSLQAGEYFDIKKMLLLK